MDTYRFEDNKLFYNADKFIAFDFSIKQARVFNTSILVILHQFGDATYNQNVFAIDFKGEIIWQIERSEEFDLIGNCPYADIQVNNSEVMLINWCGFMCKINPSTGKIIEQLFTK